MIQLRNQGMVLGEGHEKMSKSRGNVVAPDDLVRRYGADTVRAYLIFFARWDMGAPWDSQGIEGTFLLGLLYWVSDPWIFRPLRSSGPRPCGLRRYGLRRLQSLESSPQGPPDPAERHPRFRDLRSATMTIGTFDLISTSGRKIDIYTLSVIIIIPNPVQPGRAGRLCLLVDFHRVRPSPLTQPKHCDIIQETNITMNRILQRKNTEPSGDPPAGAGLAIAYLPLASRFGYYFDDWSLVWAGHTQGPAEAIQMYSIDRPFIGPVFASLYAVLGENPLPWALTGYLLRVGGGLALLAALRMVWPGHALATTSMALLFLVYPGFLRQPNTIQYQNHLISIGAESALDCIVAVGFQDTAAGLVRLAVVGLAMVPFP